MSSDKGQAQAPPDPIGLHANCGRGWPELYCPYDGAERDRCPYWGPRTSEPGRVFSFDGVNRAGSGEVALWDWIVTGRWDKLHAPVAWDDPDYEAQVDDARTACGLRGWFSIPGLFTRRGAPRCAHCCRITGFPPGKGSPKNDDACRPLVAALLGGGDA